MLRRMASTWPAGPDRRIPFETSGLADPGTLAAAVRGDWPAVALWLSALLHARGEDEG